MCIIYRKYTAYFVSGIQNVFLVEVSNRNYAHDVFFIPRLYLEHKKHVGHYSLHLTLLENFTAYKGVMFTG